MRKIDEQKKQRIKQAVLSITRCEGLQALSFGKIARTAQVSSGTPYVYYQDKADMLGQLYLEVKLLFDTGLQADINEGKTLREQVFRAVNHFIEMFVNYPLEANFMMEINNNPQNVAEAVFQKGNELAAPMMTLFEESVQQGKSRVTDPALAAAMLFGPPRMLMVERMANEKPVDLEELQQLIWLSVDSMIEGD